MVQITFYGLVYAIAFLVLFIIINAYLKKREQEEKSFSFVIFLIIGILIGARLMYVFYYFPDYFLKNPVEIFYIWNGGLSFHGGLLGLVLAGYYFCRKNNLDFLEISDIVSLPSLIFLAIGRIANFLNSELYGKITGLSWCVDLKEIRGCRHPVQIYESISDSFIFLILLYLSRTRKLKKGLLTIYAIMLYSSLRFFIDFFREYEKTFLGLGSGQFLSLFTFMIAFYFLKKLNN